MKKKLFFVSFVVAIVLLATALLLHSCDDKAKENKTPYPSGPVFQYVEPVGTIPKEFEPIIQQNLFWEAVAFEDRVITSKPVQENVWQATLLDFYGNVLFSVQVEGSPLYATKVATSDGGMLVCSGFHNHFLIEEDLWASEKGVVSYVYKYGANGELEWERELEDYEYSDFEQCIECEDAYYFFGERETPETKVLGVASPADICVTKLSKNGTVVKTAVYGGSDFDFFECAEKDGTGFIIYCYAQSHDGIFPSDGDWKLKINDELELKRVRRPWITKKESIGIINGEPIYRNHKSLKDFDGGYVTAILDYDEFYLVISENETGEYENQPTFISRSWRYTETVYSAYDKKDKLLWRGTVDSSPDFDAMAEQYRDEIIVE